MLAELKKFFPNHSDNQIKQELKQFEKIYNDIITKVSTKIGNILTKNKQLSKISEKKQDQLIKNELTLTYPGYNQKLITILKNNIDNASNEQKLKNIVNDLLKQESNFSLIKPNYLSQGRNANEFLKTAKSIGIFDNKMNSSDDLNNRYTNTETNPSIYNYEENYKDWLGKKLLLTKDEIKEFSKEKIEAKITPFISLAKDHIKKVLRKINSTEKEGLLSKSFEEIHKQNSFFDLFKIFYKLEVDRKNSIKNNHNGVYSNHIIQIQKGQYEIQRIFALTNLYMSREYNLTYQNAKEEQDLLISKLADLGSDKIKTEYLDSEIQSDNLLYNYTRQKEEYWTKETNNSYSFSKKDTKESKKIQLDTFQIEGKYRNYDSKKQLIDILHVGTRIRKNPFSSAEKILRKSLSSYSEILDHKGFIFVIDNYEQDLTKLIRILESELGSHKTSWVEETESMQKAGNGNTNSEYNSMKGILKVSYKGKLIKEFFELLGNILESKQINQFQNELKELKNKGINESNIGKYEEIINTIENPKFQSYYKDLKEKFGEKKYSMEVEIQIFDKQNYMKAEIDENSSAFHGKYKSSQGIETLPIYFPTVIYGDTTKKVMIEELPKTEKYKYLND